MTKIPPHTKIEAMAGDVVVVGQSQDCVARKGSIVIVNDGGYCDAMEGSDVTVNVGGDCDAYKGATVTVNGGTFFPHPGSNVTVNSGTFFPHHASNVTDNRPTTTTPTTTDHRTGGMVMHYTGPGYIAISQDLGPYAGTIPALNVRILKLVLQTRLRSSDKTATAMLLERNTFYGRGYAATGPLVPVSEADIASLIAAEAAQLAADKKVDDAYYARLPRRTPAQQAEIDAINYPTSTEDSEY